MPARSRPDSLSSIPGCHINTDRLPVVSRHVTDRIFVNRVAQRKASWERSRRRRSGRCVLRPLLLIGFLSIEPITGFASDDIYAFISY